MGCVQAIKDNLMTFAALKRPGSLERFFKAFPGGYAEGDIFIGVSVPQQRNVARLFYQTISLEETAELLRDPIHEYRLTALLILVLKYEKSKTEPDRKTVVDTYLNNIEKVNNWDLVDSSAYKILGPYLFDKEKSLLYEYACSGNLWKQRIAIIATYYFIRQRSFEDALKIAEILLPHRHDLIHKAVGWMLREIGNRDSETELLFLRQHHKIMPRTMLRYAIEKFDEEQRQQFLKGAGA